jgi:hypothetical protein
MQNQLSGRPTNRRSERALDTRQTIDQKRPKLVHKSNPIKSLVCKLTVCQRKSRMISSADQTNFRYAKSALNQSPSGFFAFAARFVIYRNYYTYLKVICDCCTTNASDFVGLFSSIRTIALNSNCHRWADPPLSLTHGARDLRIRFPLFHVLCYHRHVLPICQRSTRVTCSSTS